MSSLLMALAFLTPGADPAANPATDETAVVSPAEDARTAPQLRSEVRAALKRTATTMKTAPDEAAVVLLPLYTDVREHPEMVKEDRDRYGFILRSRLKKISRAIEERLAAAAEEDADADAQAVAADQSAGDPSAGERQSAALAEEAGAPGGRAVRDNGQELVELIQSTIAPEHWDVNGGPGSIFYYAPLRVLVVRASGAAHERIGGAVGGLRGM